MRSTTLSHYMFLVQLNTKSSEITCNKSNKLCSPRNGHPTCWGKIHTLQCQ